jgi:hypothetical protein
VFATPGRAGDDGGRAGGGSSVCQTGGLARCGGGSGPCTAAADIHGIGAAGGACAETAAESGAGDVVGVSSAGLMLAKSHSRQPAEC